jgi:hypothetical protein
VCNKLETMTNKRYFFISEKKAIRKASMKTATLQFYRAITAIVMVVAFLGTVSTATAGDARRIVRSRHTAQTQIIRDTGAANTPRPVADETPINPELLKNSTPDNSAASSDANRAPVKRTTVRRR